MLQNVIREVDNETQNGRTTRHDDSLTAFMYKYSTSIVNLIFSITRWNYAPRITDGRYSMSEHWAGVGIDSELVAQCVCTAARTLKLFTDVLPFGVCTSAPLRTLMDA